jgi:hypothetical protein
MPFIKQRLNRFWHLSASEFKDYIITILVITFIFGFNDKSATFNFAKWSLHFALTFILVAISIYCNIMAIKGTALSRGVMHEYKIWTPGLVIGIIITLISNGNIYILLFSTPVFTYTPIHRLGKFRYGLNIKDEGVSAMMGAIAHFVLATIGLLIGSQLGIAPEIFLFFATMNFWLMIFNLLPIPRMPGFMVFYYSRLVYVFISTTLIAYLVLSRIGFYSWIVSLLIGGGCWLLYLVTIELNIDK